jgi:hypothetical protein
VKRKKKNIIILLWILLLIPPINAQTVAFWGFDEPVGLYPSSVLSDLSDNDYPLIMGQGGSIVAGKFGNALVATEPEKMDYPQGETRFGLAYLPVPEGRSQEPMTWMNARFTALMTNGENHLRKQVDYPHPTLTSLNLGKFDWTVEFWYKPTLVNNDYGVVFELGTGPRGENNLVTRLAVNPGHDGFILFSGVSGRQLSIPSSLLDSDWAHLAFVYRAKKKQLYHYVNGRLQDLPKKYRMKSLPPGDEDYLSICRDGLWTHPLPGSLDELRFSETALYLEEFNPPRSFSAMNAVSRRAAEKAISLPLLFAGDIANDQIIDLGSRKYLFIDDAILEKVEDCHFTVNPPKLDKCVVEDIKGTFRKHVSMVEDELGIIRMYYGGKNDCLEVRTSRDGVNFDVPDLGNGEFMGKKNVVLRDPSAMGNVFIDPKAPPSEKWKFISDYNRRGIYLFSSPDGYHFTRMRTAILPFRSGSQSNSFYDEQQDKYISYHRCDFTSTPQGGTRRTFVMTETDVVDRPWPFVHASMEDYQALEGKMNMRTPIPWYMDNGPLTPGGFAIEYPTVFEEVDTLDPAETDIYVPKAIKYPWAPDVYLAFPLLYFHYEDAGDPLRLILFSPERMKGSGPIETQLSVSRDAVNWKRYPRPAYTGIGMHAGRDIKQAYLAHGMIRRGDEIWQYYFGETRYHSSWEKSGYHREVYRLVQRLDGFVSIDSPYGKEGYVYTKPFRFTGKRLVLNVDTDAAGYVQVGFLDDEGEAIPGYGLDNCIYINGDFTGTEVEWLQNADELESLEIHDEEDYIQYARNVRTSKDVSFLTGRTVQLVFRMRGSKLYAMEFKEN